MRKWILKLITAYQNMPLSSHGHCKFVPTCSEYTKQAIMCYGVWKGSWLGFKRILRCNPWNPGGYDPLPKNEGKEVRK